MKKATVIGIVTLCTVLSVACTAPDAAVSSAANVPNVTSNSIPVSSAVSDAPLSGEVTPQIEAQRAYQEYAARVQLGLELYGGYFDTHAENASSQKIIAENKAFTFGEKTVTMEKFTAEEGKLLRFSLFYVENSIETYITYYPIDEELSYCQKRETFLGDQQSGTKARANIAKFDLRSYFINEQKHSAYLAVPVLEMAFGIDSTYFPNVLEMELLFETGNESIWRMWEELSAVRVPTDAAEFPKESVQKYTDLTEETSVGPTTDIMDATAPAKRVNYLGHPATMTKISDTDDRYGRYFIESERETRRGEEIVMAINEELTYTQRLISIYSDWSWSTRTNDDFLEYQIFHLVQEGDVVYSLIPECRVAIRSEDFETLSTDDLNIMFEAGIIL